MVREVDQDFVKELVSSFNVKLDFTNTILPVWVVGTVNLQKPEMSQYEMLGGNHLIQLTAHSKSKYYQAAGK